MLYCVPLLTCIIVANAGGRGTRRELRPSEGEEVGGMWGKSEEGREEGRDRGWRKVDGRERGGGELMVNW